MSEAVGRRQGVATGEVKLEPLPECGAAGGVKSGPATGWRGTKLSRNRRAG